MKTVQVLGTSIPNIWSYRLCVLLPPMVCSAWLMVVGGQVKGSRLWVQAEGCCTTRRAASLYLDSQPTCITWTFLMAYSKVKLKSNGDRASPCFKPFLTRSFFLSFSIFIGRQLSIWNCCKLLFSLLYNYKLLCFWRLAWSIVVEVFPQPFSGYCSFKIIYHKLATPNCMPYSWLAS